MRTQENDQWADVVEYRNTYEPNGDLFEIHERAVKTGLARMVVVRKHNAMKATRPPTPEQITKARDTLERLERERKIAESIIARAGGTTCQTTIFDALVTSSESPSSAPRTDTGADSNTASSPTTTDDTSTYHENSPTSSAVGTPEMPSQSDGSRDAPTNTPDTTKMSQVNTSVQKTGVKSSSKSPKYK